MKRNFKCDPCNKTFSQIGNLNLHIETVHENTRNHQCQSCNYTCSTKSVLKKHVLSVHEKIQDYKCTVNTLLVVGGNRKSSKDYEVPPSENDTFLCQ